MDILEKSYFLVPNWKWIVFVAALTGAWFLRPLIRGILAKAKQIPKRWHHSKENFWEHLLDSDLEKPISGMIMLFIWKATIDGLVFPEGFDKYLTVFLKIWVLFYIVHLAFFAVDALSILLLAWARKSANNMNNQLVPFTTRFLKIVLLILGFLALLENLGVKVVPLLAGLSIGGLALALAAQETFANLFGSITIFFDNPFKIGDVIRIGDSEGVVEDIGFRSTRLRTPGNSVVSIPNSVVAKEKIDNLGVRPARRIRAFLNLTYDTTPDKMESFCDAVRQLLIHDPEIDPTTVMVYFTNYGASSLDVLMIYHVRTTDNEQELRITEKVNLEIWKIADRLKVEFAYPTQTVFYKNQINP